MAQPLKQNKSKIKAIFQQKKSRKKARETPSRRVKRRHESHFLLPFFARECADFDIGVTNNAYRRKYFYSRNVDTTIIQRTDCSTDESSKVTGCAVYTLFLREKNPVRYSVRSVSSGDSNSENSWSDVLMFVAFGPRPFGRAAASGAPVSTAACSVCMFQKLDL